MERYTAIPTREEILTTLSKIHHGFSSRRHVGAFARRVWERNSYPLIGRLGFVLNQWEENVDGSRDYLRGRKSGPGLLGHSIHRPIQSLLMSLRRLNPSRSNPGPRTTILPCEPICW